MSGEVLKNKVFSDLFDEIEAKYKTCSFFWINVRLGGLSSQNSNVREKNRVYALKEVNKCISYIKNKFSESEEVIESYFCK